MPPKKGPNSNPGQSARFRQLIDDAENALATVQSQLEREERRKLAMTARLGLLQTLTNQQEHHGEAMHQIHMALVRASSEHQATKNAQPDKETIFTIARNTIPMTFQDLPDSIDAFIAHPQSLDLIHRLASLSPDDHAHIHSEFARAVSGVISHVECHGQASPFFLDLSRDVKRYCCYLMLHRSMSADGVSPPPRDQGWWARVASTLPLDPPLALLAREMNTYLLTHASSRMAPCQRGGAKEPHHVLQLISKLDHGPAGGLNQPAGNAGVLDYKRLYQLPHHAQAPAQPQANIPRHSSNGSAAIQPQAIANLSRYSSNGSAAISGPSQLSSTRLNNNQQMPSVGVRVGEGRPGGEQEALAAMMGLRQSCASAPPGQTAPDQTALGQAFINKPHDSHQSYRPEAAPAPAASSIHVEIEHLSSLLKMDDILSLAAKDSLRIIGIQRLLFSSFFSRVAESYEPFHAARALCCSWPHSIASADCNELMAEYEIRAQVAGMLPPRNAQQQQ